MTQTELRAARAQLQESLQEMGTARERLEVSACFLTAHFSLSCHIIWAKIWVGACSCGLLFRAIAQQSGNPVGGRHVSSATGVRSMYTVQLTPMTVSHFHTLRRVRGSWASHGVRMSCSNVSWTACAGERFLVSPSISSPSSGCPCTSGCLCSCPYLIGV